MTEAVLNDTTSEIVQRQPTILRIFAQFFSVLFHPIFVPLYIGYFLLFMHPLLFAGYDLTARIKLIGTLFVNLTMLPAVTVFLCWRLKFVQSMKLDSQRDRIIPLAAVMIFYFWCWFVLKNFSELPALFRQFLLGCFITTIGAWLGNIYFKVSLHGLAMGGACFFMFLTLYLTDGGSAQYFAGCVLAAGLVCTSRLLLGSHRPFELYSGFFIGAFCQAAAYWI